MTPGPQVSVVSRGVEGRVGTAALPLATAWLAACASTPFVSSWQAPDAEPLTVGGSKVAAIVMMDNVSSRREAEDALARELELRGAAGVPLYTILPETRPVNEAAVKAAMERAGVDGAVVMRPIGTETEAVRTPAVYAGPVYRGFWDGYYGFGWRASWSIGAVAGGDIRMSRVVAVETLVYSLRQNKLVWGGQSKTTNPANVDRLVQDTAAKAAKELQRRGLIAG